MNNTNSSSLSRSWLKARRKKLAAGLTKSTRNRNANPTTRWAELLLIDKLLNVARHGGEQRFVDGTMWATQFARYAALAPGRDTIRVDIEALTIGC